jgi:hypothetical protein
MFVPQCLICTMFNSGKVHAIASTLFAFLSLADYVKSDLSMVILTMPTWALLGSDSWFETKALVATTLPCMDVSIVL